MSPENKLPTSRPEKEMKEAVPFIDTSLSNAARCVDGRPAGEETPEAEQGPQTLGGSIGASFIRAIEQNVPFTTSFIGESMKKLTAAGHKTGVHTDTHAPCGCGFCGKLAAIHAKAVSQREAITQRLTPIYEANGLDVQALHATYDRIAAYDPANIQVQGVGILQAATDQTLGDAAAKMETVLGGHGESKGLVNTQEGKTLNTKAYNREGKQAFNLDLWAVLAQGEALETDKAFATHANLVYYAATEAVLVQDQGNAALPIIVYN